MINGFKPISFDQALPRLVSAYNKGKLVPFTGSGLSAPAIPTWQDFISKLSSFTNIRLKDKKDYSPKELINDSENIVNVLYRQSRDKFIASVKECLKPDGTKYPTKHCDSLSKIWWPLVLSTNYDSMFVESYIRNQGKIDGLPISVYGRSQVDCHSLLTALNSPYSSAYWALQGFFGDSVNGKDLNREIIVNYRQYRNVTYNNAIFRSVFAEIFRNYSLFFIGSGLSEDYFTGLFGEVLEKLGSNPHTHCALFREEDLESGKIDHKFLHTKLNTIAISYKGGHEALHEYIDRLDSAIKGKTKKLWKVGFAPISFSNLGNDNAGELEIIADRIPVPKHDECCIFSVGYNNKNNSLRLGYLGTYLADYSELLKIKVTDSKRINNTHLWRYGQSHIYALAARTLESDNGLNNMRDLRLVSETLVEAFKELGHKYKVIHITLLAAGIKRKFPAVFSLIQMLRGYKKFVSENAPSFLFKIHIVDSGVLHYVRKNALEIEELLNCDDIKINVEIHEGDEIDRFQAFLNPDKTIKEVSEYYDIESQYWNVNIIPLPVPFMAQKPTVDSEETLDDLGLIPGSTLQYTRKDAKILKST